MKVSFKRSIRFRFTFMVLASLFAFMAIQLLLNMNLLDRYYQNQQKNTAILEISKLNEIMDRYEFDGQSSNLDDDMISEVEEVLKRCYMTNNMRFMILSTSNEVLFNSSGQNENLYSQLQDLIFQQTNKVKILYSCQSYQVVLSQDRRSNISFLSGFGFLNSGCTFLVSMPLESIQVSAAISNRFFMEVGILLILITCIIIYFLMKRLTQPVLELSDIASRMANLDFEATYQGEEEDEIGQLGNSMNHMSMILKKTIEELQDANVQLQRDNDKLQKVDEMRKEFLSGVSHELKTPIAIIRGYAEGLQDCVNEDPESRAFYCDVIMDEAGKMNRMVSKLLKLNQLEFEDTVIEPITFDMNEMIENMLQSFQILVEDKNGRTEFVPCQNETWVSGDAFLIEEVLQNYLSNACNHLKQQGLIRVSTEITDTGHVKVTVFNEGNLIPEEALNQVWIRFFKVDKARTRAYGGSGIGLSLVKAIMDQHNCGYGVENVTAGVSFWFELPLSEEQEDGSD